METYKNIKFKNRQLNFEYFKMLDSDNRTIKKDYEKELGYILIANDNSYFYQDVLERDYDLNLLTDIFKCN